MTRAELEALYLEQEDFLDRVLASLARRSSLGVQEAAAHAAWVKARIVDNDSEVLAKFNGESTLTTYLTVVATMLTRQRLARYRDV
jgi:hypothetical protein